MDNVVLPSALDQAFDGMIETLAEKVADRVLSGRYQKDLYTPADLAKRYSVSKDTIVRWMRDGLFGETVNVTDKIHLITAAAVREFETSRTGPAYCGSGHPAVTSRRRKLPRGNPGPI